MNKKLYSKKYDSYTKIPRRLYKTLRELMSEDQIGEFYIGFETYVHNQEFRIKDVIMNMLAFSELITSETFLEELNNNTDENGDVDWNNLLDKYRNEENIKVVYQ